MVKTNPLISVIIPVYNVEQYLDECVQSVLDQNYQNLEIILVDDGSTDSSGEICDRYEKKYQSVRVIHKKNGGLSSARNCGFEHATGEYIYFLDSDDYIAKEAMEKLLLIAMRNKADIVFFDAESFSDMDVFFKGKDNYVRKNFYESGTGFCVLEQLLKNREYHSAVPLLFLNRDFLMNHNLRFFEGIVFEDMIYTFQVFCLAKRVAQCNQAFYQRRFRSDSIMTTKKSKKYFDSCFIAYQAVQQFVLDQEILNSDVARAYITRLAFNIFNNYDKMSSRDKKECRTEFMQAKKDMQINGFYHCPSLKARYYGKVCWGICKISEKIFKR